MITTNFCRSRQLRLALIFLFATGPACVSSEFKVDYSKVEKTAPDPAPRAAHQPFEALDEVDGMRAGLIGDGESDNTAAFRELFSRPGQQVIISPGDYLTGSFAIPGNTRVILSAGVSIRDNGELSPSERLVRIAGDHVEILGNGATVQANRADYTTGEQRHGVHIFGVSDVRISGIRSVANGGDGFYIGGPRGKPSTDISLVDCYAADNRRQGLSITNARRVDIIDCVFSDTNGTPPAAGIDLEPNMPIDYLDRISIIRARTSGNRGGGILLVVKFLDATSAPIDVTIFDHRSTEEAPPFRSISNGRIPGSARYISLK